MREDRNESVLEFLDAKALPHRDVIDALRKLIKESVPELQENIKWNGPNFSLNGEDRITLRIHPETQVQVVFHCGAKTVKPLEERLLREDHGILQWKGTDRAVATFKTRKEIEQKKDILKEIVAEWIRTSTGGTK